MIHLPCDLQVMIVNNPVDQSGFCLFQVKADTICHLLSYISLHLVVILGPLGEDLKNLGHRGWHGFWAQTRANQPFFT